MNVTAFDFSQPVVNDGVYHMLIAQVRPSFEVNVFDRDVGFKGFYANARFIPGRHYCIHHSHHDFSLESEVDLKTAETYLRNIEWDIGYFNFALSRLTFDVHQEAIQILTHHIARDKVYLGQVQEKIQEIKCLEAR